VFIEKVSVWMDTLSAVIAQTVNDNRRSSIDVRRIFTGSCETENELRVFTQNA